MKILEEPKFKCKGIIFDWKQEEAIGNRETIIGSISPAIPIYRGIKLYEKGKLVNENAIMVEAHKVIDGKIFSFDCENTMLEFAKIENIKATYIIESDDIYDKNVLFMALAMTRSQHPELRSLYRGEFSFSLK